jgi:uncharacterized membrane protein YcaP (DUF421 family)
MGNWLTADWSSDFAPKMALTEILLRGVLVYAGLVVLLRVIPKRNAGKTSVGDMLFVVVVAGLAVEGIARPIESLADFLVLLVVVLLCSYAMDWLSFRYQWFRRLIEEPPTCLVRDGEILHENLRAELMTEEELKAHLRRQDVDDVAKVKEAQLESDGEVSVVTKKDDDTDGCETSPEECAGEERNGVHRLNGRPRPPHEDAEVAVFLAAARKLEEKIADHERRAAAYRAALARYGVRPPRKNGRAPGAGREAASPGGSP